jgi:hypothetical protein
MDGFNNLEIAELWIPLLLQSKAVYRAKKESCCWLTTHFEKIIK